MICGRCGHTIPEGQHFCEECGAGVPYESDRKKTESDLPSGGKTPAGEEKYEFHLTGNPEKGTYHPRPAEPEDDYDEDEEPAFRRILKARILPALGILIAAAVIAGVVIKVYIPKTKTEPDSGKTNTVSGYSEDESVSSSLPDLNVYSAPEVSNLETADIKRIFMEANDMYIRWIEGAAAREIFDTADAMESDGQTFYRLDTNSFKSTEDLHYVLSQYFDIPVFASAVETKYKDGKNGLYGLSTIGKVDGAVYGKYSISVNYTSVEKCYFTIAGYKEGKTDYSEADFSAEYEMIFDGTNWIFTDVFEPSWGLFKLQENIEWVEPPEEETTTEEFFFGIA